MTKNRIVEVRHQVHSLTPAQAEVRFTVVAAEDTPAVEVRGKLTGPPCASPTTIETPYPLQLVSEMPLTVRAVIPDPSMWDPAAPYLYRAHLELWQDGVRCDERDIDIGLRMRK